MIRLELRDELLKALFWIRAVELKCWPRRNHLVRPEHRPLLELQRLGIAKMYRPRYSREGEVWTLTRQGGELLDEVMSYEKDNPRYSAEEGPSALFHSGTLLTWSHLTAVKEIENLRQMRHSTATPYRQDRIRPKEATCRKFIFGQW
jgi:hypothetical protein